MSIGCASFVRLDSSPDYVPDILPGLVMLGLSAPFVFVTGLDLVPPVHASCRRGPRFGDPGCLPMARGLDWRRGCLGLARGVRRRRGHRDPGRIRALRSRSRLSGGDRGPCHPRATCTLSHRLTQEHRPARSRAARPRPGGGCSGCSALGWPGRAYGRVLAGERVSVEISADMEHARVSLRCPWRASTSPRMLDAHAPYCSSRVRRAISDAQSAQATADYGVSAVSAICASRRPVPYRRWSTANAFSEVATRSATSASSE